MKVKFIPENKEFEIDSDESILEVAKRNNIFIKYLCNGQASCAECRIRIVEGEHNVVSPNSKEISQIGSMYYVDNRRLSCQLKCFGDVVIDTSDHVGKEGETVKKARGAKNVSSAVTGQMFASASAVDEDERRANQLVLEQEREQVLRKIKEEKKHQKSSDFYSSLKSGVDYREYDAGSSKRKKFKRDEYFSSFDDEEKELDLDQLEETSDPDLNQSPSSQSQKPQRNLSRKESSKESSHQKEGQSRRHHHHRKKNQNKKSHHRRNKTNHHKR